MLNLKRVTKFLLLLQLLVSCNRGSNVKREIVRVKEMKIIYYENIEPNKEYIGKIIMDHSLDSIKLKEKDLRNTSLYLTQSEKVLSVKYLDENKDNLSRFGEIEEGEYYLEGIVDDAILLDNYYGNGESRILNKLTKLSEKVIVKK